MRAILLSVMCKKNYWHFSLKSYWTIYPLCFKDRTVLRYWITLFSVCRTEISAAIKQVRWVAQSVWWLCCWLDICRSGVWFPVEVIFVMFTELLKALVSLVISAFCPLVIAWYILYGFSWNFMFEEFLKIYQKFQVLLKFDYSYLYFTWRQIYTLYVQKLFSKNCAVCEVCVKIWYSQTGHGWQYNMVHAHCMLDN